MIDRRGPRRRVQAACLLPLLLALAGCGNSLEHRIGTLHSSVYDVQPHEPDAHVEEGQERPPMRARGRGSRAGDKPDANVEEGQERPRTRARSRSSRTGDTQAPRRQTTEIDSITSRMSRWKPVPADHKRTPDQHSPEWVREQAEAAEKDRTLDRRIRSICRGC